MTTNTGTTSTDSHHDHGFPMNKWFVEGADNYGWYVVHYIGGEDYDYTYEIHRTQREAEVTRDILNKCDIRYHFKHLDNMELELVLTNDPDINS